MQEHSITLTGAEKRTRYSLNATYVDNPGLVVNSYAGMSTLEIDKLVYEYTKDHGGIPATLGYEGFPKSCCTRCV